jgi:hypothetical protein
VRRRFLLWWLKYQEFIELSPIDADRWFEVAWPHTTGFGYVTTRLWVLPDGRYSVIVCDGPDRGINIGFTRSVVVVMVLCHALWATRYRG